MAADRMRDAPEPNRCVLLTWASSLLQTSDRGQISAKRRELNDMKKIYNDDTLLKRIKKQIRIWEAYYNETGHYREETIFLDTGDTAVYDPYVSECMRFKIGRASCRERVCQYV